MKTYTLVLLCFLVTSFSFSEVSEKEKDALLAFYKATNGEKWNHTWNLDEPLENWYGVTVENDQVVELNLHFNNLQGTLPNEIGNLVNLRKLNLGFNQLEGILPLSLGNLTALVSLELFMNKFEGNLPSEICNLNNLQV